MIIKDTFSKFTNISKLSGCIAFFVNEKSEIAHLKKYLGPSNHINLNVLPKMSVSDESAESAPHPFC